MDDHGQAALVPTDIEGISVVTTVEARQKPIDGGASCTVANPCHADQLSLPVEMGNSRGPESLVLPDSQLCDTCTLGFKVCSYGTHYYVTAGHCSRGNDGCPAAASFGADTYHVGAFDVPPPDEQCTITQDMEKVGTVVAHAYPTCGAQNARWDAALIQSSDALTSWAIRDVGTPNPWPSWVLPQDAVHKSGRTTGQTFGEVHAVNYETIQINTDCCEDDIKWVGQVRVVAETANFDNEGNLVGCDVHFIRPGDSGSALLHGDSVAGLLFLGRFDGCAGTATRVQDVSDAFGLCAASCDQQLQDCLANCGGPPPSLPCDACDTAHVSCCRSAALTPNCS